jgi:hypothetical protein
MFSSKHVGTHEDGFHRERQLVAKYSPLGLHDMAYVQIQYGDETLHSSIYFGDRDTEEENIADACAYAKSFNEAWVIIEMVVEELHER